MASKVFYSNINCLYSRPVTSGITREKLVEARAVFMDESINAVGLSPAKKNAWFRNRKSANKLWVSFKAEGGFGIKPQTRES